MIIETHAHFLSSSMNDLQEHIDFINNSGKYIVVNVGMDEDTSKESVSISSNPLFYSAIGIHPLNTPDLLDNIEKDVSFLYPLASNDKVVAIGEIGLDTNKDNSLVQEAYFIRQIEIANELKLPVIIHSSNSNNRVIEIFETIVRPLYGCVFHCFQPDIEVAEYLVSKGYYISFANKINSPNAKKSIEVAKFVPMEYILVETDCPYISPDTSYIDQVIEKLASIKNLNYQEVCDITTLNALRLFEKIKL